MCKCLCKAHNIIIFCYLSICNKLLHMISDCIKLFSLKTVSFLSFFFDLPFYEVLLVQNLTNKYQTKSYICSLQRDYYEWEIKWKINPNLQRGLTIIEIHNNRTKHVYTSSMLHKVFLSRVYKKIPTSFSNLLFKLEWLLFRY